MQSFIQSGQWVQVEPAVSVRGTYYTFLASSVDANQIVK